MTRSRISILIAAAVAAAGLGVGLATAVGNSGTPAQPAAAGAPSYTYYQSMMSRYLSGTGGSMMGGTDPSYGWMMGQAGYQWMFGGTSAPAWMRGGQLPVSMMGTGTDMGQVMGQLWAGAPGPRISAAQAAALGNQVPAGASIDRAASTITFTTTTVRLTILASPAGSSPGSTSGSASSTPTRCPWPGWSRSSRPSSRSR